MLALRCVKFRARAFCQFSRALGTLLDMSLYRDRIVAVIVNPADLALLVAIDEFILARGLHRTTSSRRWAGQGLPGHPDVRALTPGRPHAAARRPGVRISARQCPTQQPPGAARASVGFPLARLNDVV